MSFEAQYRGECDACDEPINVGDLIRRNDLGCYVHAECPEATPEKPTKFQGTSVADMGY